MTTSSALRQSLNLLLIADRDDNPVGLFNILQGPDRDCHILRVASADSLREAMQDQAWDLALYLSDATTLDLAIALELVNESGTDLPIIMLATPGPGPSVGKAMTMGVRDVIDADRLDHLLPAIDREVREARHRGDHPHPRAHHQHRHDCRTGDRDAGRRGPRPDPEAPDLLQ